MDQLSKDKKNSLAGQLSLFDIADEDSKESFEIRMPDVEDYPKEMALSFEKEVLGIYVSGHPLETYSDLWQKVITNMTNDFALDEETGVSRVQDGAVAIVGGLIINKQIKYTKQDKIMAFLTIEDLVGTVEVIVFTQSYEKYGPLLTEDAKVFVRGRISVEEDKDSKLICDQIVTFDEAAERGGTSIFSYRFNGTNYNSGLGRNQYRDSRQNHSVPAAGKQTANRLPNGLWIQFETPEEYQEQEQLLLQMLEDSDGNDDVVIFIRSRKNFKVLPPNRRVRITPDLVQKLSGVFGESNVKIRS